MLDQIEAYIAAHRDRFLDELKQWLRFPSVSAQRDHDTDTLACAEWIKDHLGGLGLEVRLIDRGGKPIVWARAQGKAGRPAVIYGHYDVQPEEPVDQWKTRPFEPVIQEGFICARGASDDKGQVFAHVKAVEALLRTGSPLPCDIVFLLEGEEECGGDALPRYIREEKDLRPRAVIVSDSSMYDERTPAMTYGLRGIAALEITLRGPAKDVHSGSYGGAVANPAVVLSRLIAQCIGPDGKILVPGLYDDVVPVRAWEKENLQRLAFDDEVLKRELAVPHLFGEDGYSTLERLWARPTFEINGLFGGYTGQGAKTIVPASATAKVSLRLVPRQDPAKVRSLVLDHIRSICPNTVRLEISAGHSSPPVLFDVKDPAIRAAQKALRFGFGAEPVFIRCGGSIPVVNTFVEEWGCPVLLMGFGLDSDGAHSPNERFKVDSFFKGARASAHLLSNM
ncbi:MAG: dipeptidase [Phycisphaerae bacterium]|nr:dipeptidase [Phycisphaerae bacterium]